MYRWKTIDSAPVDGTLIYVTGGQYDTPYSQMHGFMHDEVTLVKYVSPVNPKVDPPWVVMQGEVGLHIKNPTHWHPMPAAPLFHKNKEN